MLQRSLASLWIKQIQVRGWEAHHHWWSNLQVKWLTRGVIIKKYSWSYVSHSRTSVAPGSSRCWAEVRRQSLISKSAVWASGKVLVNNKAAWRFSMAPYMMYLTVACWMFSVSLFAPRPVVKMRLVWTGQTSQGERSNLSCNDKTKSLTNPCSRCCSVKCMWHKWTRSVLPVSSAQRWTSLRALHG